MSRYKILNLYIFKKLLIAFVTAEIIYSIIFFIQNIFILSSLIVEKNAPADKSFLLILYMLPKTIISTIPFAVIFAALFVTFQLASTSELIAINSSGIPIRNQKKPYFAFAVLISIVYSILVFHTLPISKQKRDSLINQINIKAVVYSLKPGEFNKISDSFYLYARKVQKNIFEDIVAFHYNNFNNFEIIFSRQANLELNENNLTLSLKFFKGRDYAFSKKNSSPRLSESSFGKKTLLVSINPEYLKKKDTKKSKTDKFTLNKLYNLLKINDKTAISIFTKRIAMILFVFFSPFLGFYLGFSLKRGAVVSGAIVYGFVISFFYIMFLNIFINLMLHRTVLGFFFVFLLIMTLLYFLLLNRERIEKPLSIRTKKSLTSAFKNKINLLQLFFERNFIKKIEEKELISFKFPLLLRYILFDFFKTFLVFFLILQSIYLLTVTLKIIVNLFKYKGNILIGIKYIVFSTIAVYPLIIPFSFLMSALFFFMSLEDKNEVIAIKSSGISLYTVIMPIGYFALIVSTFLLILTTLFSPIASKKSSFLYYDINSKKKEMLIHRLKLKNRSVIKSLNNKGGFYWCDYYDFDNSRFINFISIDFDFTSGELNKIYKAKTLLFNKNSININKVIGSLLIEKDNSKSKYVFSHKTKPLIWDSMSFFREIEPEPENMTQFELRNFISRKKAMGVKPYKYITNYYYRFASAFSPLVLLILGLPLVFMGEGRKKNPIRGIGISLVLVILYYTITSIALGFGTRHYLPSFFAAWITNLFFTLTGLYLFTKIRT